MQFAILMKLVIGIVGFTIWTIIVFYAPELQNSEYLKFVQGAVVAVVALALQDKGKPKEEVKNEPTEEVKQ